MNNLMIQGLMDPAGAPSHPVIFLVLGVVTLALHLTAVGIMLGSLLLGIYASFRKSNPFWEKLGFSMVYTSKVAVSIALVLGVAPLLFVQVIYDPFWYTANILSARWMLYFLIFLTVAYLCLYGFLGIAHKKAGLGVNAFGTLLLVVALILFIHCGLVMHAISGESLLPGEWMNWYAPDGVIQPNGRKLHFVLLPRLLFFLSLGIAFTGAWLLAYCDYSKTKPQADAAYLAWVRKVGAGWSWCGALIASLLAVWWMFKMPEALVTGNFGLWTLVLAVGVLLLWVPAFLSVKGIFKCSGYWAVGAIVLSALVLCAFREAIRFDALLTQVGWNPLDYKVAMDWPSTLVFFATFLLVGGVTLAYILTVAWNAFRSKGIYTPSEGVNTLGKAAISLLVLWVVVYFGVSVVFV